MGLGTSEEYRWTSGGRFYSLVTLLFAFLIQKVVEFMISMCIAIKFLLSVVFLTSVGFFKVFFLVFVYFLSDESALNSKI